MTTQTGDPAIENGGHVLAVDELHVSYHRAGRTIAAVNGVSFGLSRGERLAVIGESGSGKSTITQALLGVLPVNAEIGAEGGQLVGTRIFEGLTEKQWNALRRGRVAYIPQDPNIALNPVRRVGKQLAEAIRFGEPDVERAAWEGRAKELLAQVGIEDVDRVHDAFPHQLSGGQRQRVLIAIALVGDPELIVADEPTSGLDVAVQKLVLDLLDEIVETRGVAVLLVTHDLAVASQRSDRILVLQAGRIVEIGATAEIVSRPTHTYTRRLLDAVPQASRTKLAARPEVPVALEPEELGVPHVQVDALDKTYRQGRGRRVRSVVHAAREVSFSIGRGQTFGLVGQSGSGKSTIARLIAGIDTPDAGEVLVGGRHLTGGSRAERREASRRVQFVFQNPYGSLDPKHTVRRLLAEPLEGLGQPTRGTEAETRIAEALDAVSLAAATISRRPGELSGGQRQRVAIARAIITRPELLVLDEPTSALDVSVQAQILQVLADIQQEFGTTYLFISHDLAVISQISDRVGVLRHGVLVEESSVVELLDDPTDDYTRLLMDAIPTLAAA